MLWTRRVPRRGGPAGASMGARGASRAWTTHPGTRTSQSMHSQWGGTRIATPPWAPPPGPGTAGLAKTRHPGKRPAHNPAARSFQCVSCSSVTRPSIARPWTRARFRAAAGPPGSTSHLTFHVASRQLSGSSAGRARRSRRASAATSGQLLQEQTSPQVRGRPAGPARCPQMARARAAGERGAQRQPAATRCGPREARAARQMGDRMVGRTANHAGLPRASQRDAMAYPSDHCAPRPEAAAAENV